MTPKVQAFFDPATSTATFLVSDPVSKAAAIIDPVLDYEPNSGKISTTSADALIAAVHAQGLTLTYILETHAHADHLTAGSYLRHATGAPIVIGAEITQIQKHFIPIFDAEDVTPDGRDFDRLVREGDELPLGRLSMKVMHTPGHTAADITYLIGDAAFVGDTLFMPDYGTARTDFPGGSAAILYRSIRNILALPPQTRLFVGHDYLPPGRVDARWETTVREQRESNIHIHDGVNEREFNSLRKARDQSLAAPRLLLPSLQVSICAGALPPATASGHQFLRIPVSMP